MKPYKNLNNFVAISKKSEKVASMVNQAGDKGNFFSVSFIKKDRTIRNMVCRLGVTSHLKGGVRTASPSNIVVFDTQKKEYRSFNPDSVLSVNKISVD